MKKILLKLALLGATLFAYDAANAQTVAVNADLKTMFNAAAATKTQVCFSLTDGNGNQLSNPRTSSGVLVPTATQCVLPDGSGHISTTVIANDQITPANSIYSVTYTFNGRVVHGDIFQFALADGTENLNTKISLSVIPIVPSPTGDTTYARLDGANQPFTANVTAPILNATTGFRLNGSAPLNHFLVGNGTNYVDASSLPLVTVTSPTGTGFAHITSGAWDATAKLISLTASTDVAANQGTTTTLLHGNAAGQLAFGSVVSSDLNITPTTCTNQFLTAISATGGGTCTTATLTSAQFANQGTTTTVLHGNAAGNLAFGATVLTTDVSGVLPQANGGTGQNSTAVFPTSGNIVSEAATETLSSKRITQRVVTLTTSTTFTPDGDNSDLTQMNMTGVAGTLTIAAPTGTPTDAQKLILRVKTTNAQTYSFNATYRFSTTTVAPTVTGAAKTDLIGLIWNATDTKWDVVAVDQGH